MIDRKEILKKAYHDCMCEMYAKAQPAADWDNLVEEYRQGKIGKDERIYERHYLSQYEFKYILEKYKRAYNIKEHWNSDIEVVEDYLKNGGHKNAWVEEETDSDGFTHPGYRSYKEVPPIKEQISNKLNGYLIGSDRDNMSQEITDIVMNAISDCKTYYKFDYEENGFSCDVCLGASPTSNPETVKKWWKENYDQDIEIEERNPILFWYMDNDYTDEELEEEFDREDWREYVDEEWKKMTPEEKHNYF